MKIEQLKKEAQEIGLKSFYEHVRSHYLQKHGFEVEIKSDKEVETLVDRVSDALKIEKDKLWESKEFLAFRVTDVDVLPQLGIEEKLVAGAKKSVEGGRAMRILPLNVLLGGDTIKKFVPSLPELYDEEDSLDPYWIFTDESAIKAGERTLASRKFDNTVLANITNTCYTGCAGCYKGPVTNLLDAALAKIDPKYKKIAEMLDQKEEEAIEQIRLLTEWLDKHEEVNTVILSGGEPLIYSEKTIGTILDMLSETKYVKKVRICTSSVFQGSFSYLTDEMIEEFKKFRKKSKKQLYINAHVTDEHQILAPEARVATEKLKDAGINDVRLQMPIMEGVNFYRDNVKKSAEKLKRICDAADETGAVPYKAIVDMHSSKHPSLTVPIEKVSETISFLDSHFDTSDQERWQAYNILTKQGNAYVYGKPHFVAEKEVDEDRKTVTYFIPKVDPLKGISVHTYEEPLLEGMNDGDTLPWLTDQKTIDKINEVKEAYYRFRDEKIDAREFCQISGIKFSENEPLVN